MLPESVTALQERLRKLAQAIEEANLLCAVLLEENVMLCKENRVLRLEAQELRARHVELIAQSIARRNG